MDLNRAQVLGRLTQDPEVRQTPSGQSVVSFTVATNRTWKDNNGEQKEQAEFHNIVAWGKLAEIVGNYAKKGKRLYVEGRLQTRSWEDNTGMKRWKTEMVADNVILLDGGRASDEGGGPVPADDSFSQAAESNNPPARAPGEDDISVEDVPF